MKLLTDVVNLLGVSRKNLNHKRPNFLDRGVASVTTRSSLSHTESPSVSSESSSTQFDANPLQTARKSLLSYEEISLFGELRKAFSESFVVWPKPRLSDVLAFSDSENYFAAFEVQSDQVSFLLCDKANLKPLLAIRLGAEAPCKDGTNYGADQVLQEIGLKTIRFNRAKDFDIATIQSDLPETR